MTRLCALILILLLAACGPPVIQADVTRFSSMAPGPVPGDFAIQPDPQQTGSLEFQHYATLAAAQLEQMGWRPVPPTAKAGTVVLLHWGVGAPHTVVWQSPSAFAGAGFGWGPYWGGGAFPYWETESQTTWPKWVTVEMVDGAAWRAGQKTTLFEGRAVTEGTNPEITGAAPYLIRAIFTGFPGINGKTVRVEVPTG